MELVCFTKIPPKSLWAFILLIETLLSSQVSLIVSFNFGWDAMLQLFRESEMALAFCPPRLTELLPLSGLIIGCCSRWGSSLGVRVSGWIIFFPSIVILRSTPLFSSQRFVLQTTTASAPIDLFRKLQCSELVPRASSRCRLCKQPAGSPGSAVVREWLSCCCCLAQPQTFTSSFQAAESSVCYQLLVYGTFKNSFLSAKLATLN